MERERERVEEGGTEEGRKGFLIEVQSKLQERERERGTERHRVYDHLLLFSPSTGILCHHSPCTSDQEGDSEGLGLERGNN